MYKEPPGLNLISWRDTRSQLKASYNGHSKIGLPNIASDMHKREREREESKLKYKREIDEYLEDTQKTLRTQEVTLEKERIAYEQKVRERFDKIHDEARAAIANERKQLQLEEDQRAAKYQTMISFHNSRFSSFVKL